MKPRPLTSLDWQKFPILYVDDEAANLRVFELTFGREFSVLTAQNAEEGMRLFNENPVAVVLSDQKMPGMSGVEFLSRLRELDDQAVRILVTAYGDAETLGAAINDGRIYRYVAKPWDPDQMALTLRRAIERYALDRERGALIDELSLLNSLSRRLHRESDPDRVVRLLIDSAQSDLGLDAAAVLFFSPDRQTLRWAAATPRDEVAERLRSIELSRAGAPDFFESLEAGETQTFRVDQLSALEAPLRHWVSAVSAEELIIVPLVGNTGVIGAIAADNRCGGRHFGTDERTLLDSLSTQAVIALENARTAAELRSSHEHLQRVRAQLSELLLSGESQPEDGGSGAIDLSDLAREVASRVAGEAAAASVEVVVEADPATPKTMGRSAPLAQMLIGLTLSAIDATPAGEQVRLRIAPDPDEPAETVWIEIVDADPGRQPEDLQDGWASRSLLLAQRITRQLGGSVSARRSIGRGSAIDIRLPRATDDPAA